MNKKQKTLTIQIALFIATLFTTTLAGAEWRYGQYWLFGLDIPFQEYITEGLLFSIPFLLALTVHEFGHYFTARYHQVDVTLPYYIPLYFGVAPSIGTMGAFIRIKDAIRSRKLFFDIGIAGPLAGFVIALGVLYYGFTHLPSQDYVYDIHPVYHIFGDNYEDYVYDLDTVIYKKDVQGLDLAIMDQLPDTIVFSPDFSFKLGNNLLFSFFEKHVATDPELVPNHYEIIHYPWLLAGYLALFFTALNLIPIGQLDGGHILYGLIGYRNHRIVSAILFVLFVFYAGLGVISPHDFTNETWLGIPSNYFLIALYIGFLYYVFYSISPQVKVRLILALAVFTIQFLLTIIMPGIKGYEGWLLFAFLIGRFLGVYHPPALLDEPLDWKRKLLGWIALIIFIISFSPNLLVVEG
ncbi:MAG: site-2 protease family protein [Candidatus Cyclobacteriaceae bacterium M3_2C_046]